MKKFQSHNVGLKIKTLRRLAGLTQTELAKKLGYSSSGTISLIESEKRGMTLDKLFLASKILNVPPPYFNKFGIHGT